MWTDRQKHISLEPKYFFLFLPDLASSVLTLLSGPLSPYILYTTDNSQKTNSQHTINYVRSGQHNMIAAPGHIQQQLDVSVKPMLIMSQHKTACIFLPFVNLYWYHAHWV